MNLSDTFSERTCNIINSQNKILNPKKLILYKRLDLLIAPCKMIEGVDLLPKFPVLHFSLSLSHNVIYMVLFLLHPFCILYQTTDFHHAKFGASYLLPFVLDGIAVDATGSWVDRNARLVNRSRHNRPKRR